MKQLIAYCRVSTEMQGVSRNGLEAQRAEIIRFAEFNGYEIVDIVEESASGKLGLGGRPVLRDAIAKANKLKCAIVVSKLDRLSRHAAFILNLMDTKAKFIVAELGESVDTFMLHIYAVVAQKEREMISKRTKDALAQLKAKGVKLGGPKQKEASVIGAATMCTQADAWAIKMGPIVKGMLEANKSFKDIADALNSQGMKTRKGSLFTVATITSIRNRLAMSRNK
jgi:DNA invertase Pin-like site-specific DNA recombinase